MCDSLATSSNSAVRQPSTVCEGRAVCTHYREGAEESASRPGNYTSCNDILAREAVTKVSKDWGEEHIGHYENSLQGAILFVIQFLFKPTGIMAVKLM